MNNVVIILQKGENWECKELTQQSWTCIVMSLDTHDGLMAWNIFCLTGPLWRESTGHLPSKQGITGPLWGESTCDQWIPLTKGSYSELWLFLLCMSAQAIDQAVQLPVIAGTMTLMWHYCNVTLLTWSLLHIAWVLGVLGEILPQQTHAVDCWNWGLQVKANASLHNCCNHLWQNVMRQILRAMIYLLMMICNLLTQSRENFTHAMCHDNFCKLKSWMNYCHLIEIVYDALRMGIRCIKD